MIDIFDLSHVVVSEAIEIHKTSVVAVHIRFLVGSLHDFAGKVFLTLLFDLANLIVSIETIFIIVKFNFTVDLIIKRSHHTVIKSVTRVVTNDGLAIFKYDFFMTLGFYGDACQRAFYLALTPA